MTDQPGANEQPKPNPIETKKDPALELKEKFNEEARVGRGLFAINEARREERYSFSLRIDSLPSDMLSPLRERESNEVLTQADIAAARTASVGVSLEAAREIASGDLDREGSAVHDDAENLLHLRDYVGYGSELFQKAMTSDPQGAEQVARRIMGIQLGIPPEEVKITPEQMKTWAEENYSQAQGKLGQRIEAIQDYFSR